MNQLTASLIIPTGAMQPSPQLPSPGSKDGEETDLLEDKPACSCLYSLAAASRLLPEASQVTTSKH